VVSGIFKNEGLHVNQTYHQSNYNLSNGLQLDISEKESDDEEVKKDSSSQSIEDIQP
jgi:hypothetical protein